MLKITTLALIILVMGTVSVQAEGIWNVNGYIFSNVNTLQRGKHVEVSGRVSSGQVRSPLNIRLTVTNDEGASYDTWARVNNYCGKGETFDAEFNSYKKANWWKVTAISVN